MDSTRANPKALFGDWSITKLGRCNPTKKFSPRKGRRTRKMLLRIPLNTPSFLLPRISLTQFTSNLLCRDCKISRHHLAPLNARFRALKVFEFEMTAIYSVLGGRYRPPST
ncbi:hypothetical protein CDAR_257921 [Caerostris darwini]|uniref:Uncharacterized protein n=1 Tax=Caerostris darwini TaxID=1538125 RepID=A0AAV4WUP6_9ARAC|nr:hypothetical protein CDAR_257921 [Caerostris darwini]